jgi:hypothetical protein
MLGDKIGEFTGKVTGTRVVPGDDFRYVKIESSWEEQGTAYGVAGANMGTVTIFERVPGQVYGEGQGIFMSATGEGAIWNGTSVAHMTGEGMAASVRFSIAFQAPATGPLARLNGVLGVGEQEIGADGSVHTTIWEWK